jgi:hypothetical protein
MTRIWEVGIRKFIEAQQDTHAFLRGNGDPIRQPDFVQLESATLAVERLAPSTNINSSVKEGDRAAWLRTS